MNATSITEKNDIVDIHAHICSYFVFVFVEVSKGTRGQCVMNDVDCYWCLSSETRSPHCATGSWE